MIKLNKWLTKSFCQTATLMITTALANSPANAVDPLQQAKNHLKADNYAKALEYFTAEQLAVIAKYWKLSHETRPK